MTDNPLPLSLFHTGRAQCPDCGATLKLSDYGALVKCEHCGGTAVVQRRLRTIEPVISEGFLTADAPLNTARDLHPSQVIDGIAQDESHCPTCGKELESAPTQVIRKCDYCGTQSKIERRLLRSPQADEALIALEQSASEHGQRQLDATEKLIDKVEKEKDFAERVKAAHELGEMWSHANARAARLLPRVLKILQTADPRLEIPLAELIGKLLCNDQIILANTVLRAAEKFTFNINGSQSLLRQLSLGSGICLKLLLDTADYAARAGATEYACSALWGVNTMIERNYAGRMRLAEIVLYRLLYLKGPVQAWAIELCGGQLGLGCRFPMPTLLHFIDDCAVERPELVPYVQKFFYHGRAANEGDYLNQLEIVNELLTPPAKIAAMEQIYAPPPDISEKVAGECVAKLLELTKNPQIASGAIRAICDWIEDGPKPHAAIDKMVQEIGDQLPEEIRRAYFRQVPKTTLLSEMKPNYDYPKPPKPTPFDEKLDQWKQMWNAGIRHAVDRQHEHQETAGNYWQEISSPH